MRRISVAWNATQTIDSRLSPWIIVESFHCCRTPTHPLHYRVAAAEEAWSIKQLAY